MIGNDACWSQIAREQVPMFDSSVACDLLVSFTKDVLITFFVVEIRVVIVIVK